MFGSLASKLADSLNLSEEPSHKAHPFPLPFKHIQSLSLSLSPCWAVACAFRVSSSFQRASLTWKAGVDVLCRIRQWWIIDVIAPEVLLSVNTRALSNAHKKRQASTSPDSQVGKKLLEISFENVRPIPRSLGFGIKTETCPYRVSFWKRV